MDLRDLHRAGSGLTLRRVNVLIQALPAEAHLWGEVRAAIEAAKKPAIDRLRERQRYYDQREKEVEAQ